MNVILGVIDVVKMTGWRVEGVKLKEPEYHGGARTGRWRYFLFSR